MAVDMESSDDEFEILEDERCIDTSVFQNRYLLHELVLACSHPPPLRPHIIFTILTQSDWCAMRTVAKCEVALLPVAGTMRAGVRVI